MAAPIFNQSFIIAYDFESFYIGVESDQSGTVYMVLVNEGEAAPSSLQIKNGQDSTGTPVASGRSGSVVVVAGVVGTLITSGLNPSTPYDIYVVAENDLSELQVTPTQIDVTTTPGEPVFNQLEIRSVDLDSIDIRAELDQDGTVYMVLLEEGETAPSSLQIKNGQDSTGTPVASGRSTSVAMLANVENMAGSLVFNGLSASTAYDLYVVAENNLFNFQIPPTKYDLESFDIETELDEDGTIYLVIVGNNDPAPNALQVISGQDSTGATTPSGRFNSVEVLESGVSLIINGLVPPGALYDVYVITENDFHNLQNTPTNIDFSTSTTVYFVSASGSVTAPYDTPAKAHTSITGLISDIGGLNPGDTIEVVYGGDIIEISTIDPGSDDIIIRSYGTNGTDRMTNKPVIRSSAPVIFDSYTGGHLNFSIHDLDIIPQPGCSRIAQLLNGEFLRNKINGTLMDSGDSILYGEFGFIVNNNDIKYLPSIILTINDEGAEGTESEFISNTIYSFNNSIIDNPAGDVRAYNNIIDGAGVAGSKGF